MKANEGGANLPSFLSANNLAPFISETLANDLIEPVRYLIGSGGSVANGIKAELLPDICGVWLAARRGDQLHPSQEHPGEASRSTHGSVCQDRHRRAR